MVVALPATRSQGPVPLTRYSPIHVIAEVTVRAWPVAEYQPWHYERLCALPGITGLWQVEGRGRTSFDEATLLDIEYVRGWSLGLDLKLLLRTLPAVLSRKGAG